MEPKNDNKSCYANDTSICRLPSMECFDGDSISLVILGEASMLSTAILRSTQRSSSSLRTSSSVPSRLATMVIEYEEDEDGETVSDPLLKSLIRLKARLRKDKLIVNDPNYLKPFCDVIKNKDVSGPITGLALQSILKFINYGLIKTDDIGVQMIGDSVTKARFIGTDSSSDEVVLMRILNVLHELIVRRFSCLRNSAVCEIMQSCFRIAFEPRLSELLRKNSEQALVDMVQVLFQRIPEFSDDQIFNRDNVFGRINSNLSRKSKSHESGEKQSKSNDTQKEASFYGLASIHELLSYLTSLINPLPEAQNSEAMINVGLNLLTVAFETSVHGIGSKHCLLMTVKNELAWNIMLLLQNDRPLNSFAAALRLAFLIYTNLRMHLKYQFEILLIRLMDIITTGNASPEFREISLEYLVAFFRHLSHLPHELFLNYDCDPFASNLLEDLLTLFSKNCFSSTMNNQQPLQVNNQANVFSIIQMLSLDALLASLKSLQKAELCQNETLSVYPAAVLKVENVIFVEETLDSNNESEESIEKVNLTTELMNPPEDVDVGVSSFGLNDADVKINPEIDFKSQPEFKKEAKAINENEPNERIKSVQQKTVVNYNYPKFERIPNSISDILQFKHRKKLLWMASEHFNTKPAKGIQFLMENHLIRDDSDIVSFLRDNFKLDKKQIGEYLSNKKNLKILQSFVESFAFKDLRIDEALRIYLESFRLPGEAPLISLILEQFAHHWHESNGCPFANEDAAFSLAYAIIMLNVDQHNTNVKRQSNPMTCEEFISNLRQVNGGKDFDSDLLKEIYFMIKSNEIIMPAEQHGLVRERYIWKCLLRKSETESGAYWFIKDKMKPLEQVIFLGKEVQSTKEEKSLKIKLSVLNGPIFSVLWGPTVAAMTFIFDKINPDQQSGLTRRILNNGFNSCALLCATYGYLDKLIVSLSKFIQSSSNPSITLQSPVMTIKSQLAAQCLFTITREYSNEMRESWTNIVELILHWYIGKLIDNSFEFEDFALGAKKIKLKRREKKSQTKSPSDAGSTFLSSFYSYFSGNPQSSEINQIEEEKQNKELVENETDSVKESEENLTGQTVNTYAQPLLLIIEDSKFLHIDSLLELIKALINVYLDNQEEDDDIEVFKLEVVLQIILMNRDRVSVFWSQVSNYLVNLFQFCPKSDYLNERVTSAIFRLAIRFVPRPDLSEQIFILLGRMLTTFDNNMIQHLYTATALHSFVTHCHGFITKYEDWALIFDLLLYIGIGFNKRLCKTSEVKSVQSDNEDSNLDNTSKTRGYTSDSEVDKNYNSELMNAQIIPFQLINTTTNSSIYKILDLEAYEKCTEILTLIIREIMPSTVEKCHTNTASPNYPVAQLAVEVLQRYAEASIKIQISPGKTGQLRRSTSQNFASNRRTKSKTRQQTSNNKSRLSRIANAILSSSEDEDDEEGNSSQKSNPTKIQPKLSSVTETCSLKLLDLMHYLHLNASLTVQCDTPEYLWSILWCPLLQGIALFCCDSRRPVRTCALTFLQRLLHDLRVLRAHQWESCFNKVLFPLLSKLLEPINMCDPIGMDETRMRTTNLLCKVFLQHLTPLLALPTFTALWLTILDFMDKYIKAEMQTDLVKEAIPESLKNILLVMDTAGIFNNTLAAITWDRISIFLPKLRQEIMPPEISGSTVEDPKESPKETTDKIIEEEQPSYEQTQSGHSQSEPANNNSAQTRNVVLPPSTCITIEEYPKMSYSQSFGPVPGSSVMAQAVPTTQTVYFPQPSQSYVWPSHAESKGTFH